MADSSQQSRRKPKPKRGRARTGALPAEGVFAQGDTARRGADPARGSAAEREHASKRGSLSAREGVSAQGGGMSAQGSASGPDGAPPLRVVKKRKKGVLRVVVRLMLVVALLLLAFLVWRNWDTLNPGAVWHWLQVKVAGGEKGDGYPLPFEGGTVLKMQESGGQLALLTDNSFVMLNKTAGETVRRTHNYADPLMEVAGGYALVAETGGARWRLETSTSTVIEKQIGNALVTAAVNEDGMVACATDSDESHVSEIVLFNRKGVEKFHWYSADLLVTDVAISADGKTLAATAVDASGGAIRSTLLVFDVTDATAQPRRMTGRNVMLAAVEVLETGTVAAVGDTALWLLSPDGTEHRESFAGSQLLRYSVYGDRVVLALRAAGSSSGGEVTELRADGSQAYSLPFSGAYRDLAATPTGALLLTDSAALRIENGAVTAQFPIAADGLLVAPYGDAVMVLELAQIERFEG